MVNVITPYADLGTASDYVSRYVMDTSVWDRSSEAQRTKSLSRATLQIDNLNFSGVKTSPTQVSQFPRNGFSIIPDGIQVACIELALVLLDGFDPELEEGMLGTTTTSYAAVRRTSDPGMTQDHIRAGIPSLTAWRRLLPFLHDPYALVIRRV